MNLTDQSTFSKLAFGTGLVLLLSLISPLSSVAQIEPHQIGFPSDSSIIWVLGTDTLSSSPTFGNGMWYALDSLLSSGTGVDEDWLKYSSGTIPSNTDTIYHNGVVSIGTDSVLSGFLNVVGRIDQRFPNSSNNSIIIGKGAGNTLMTGSNNIGIGLQALGLITTGASNTNIGYASGYHLTTGYDNTSLGAGAGQEVTTGANNVSLGSLAGKYNLIGTANVNIGYQAGHAYLGSENVAIGYQSQLLNSTATGNTSIGSRALRNSTGGNNVAIGNISQLNSTTGNNNTSVGLATLHTLTTGADNVAIGGFSGYHGASHSNNVYVGTLSGYGVANNAANHNVGIGTSALRLIDSGSFNIAIGTNAASKIAEGSQNTVIGNTALYSSVNGNGIVAIGNEALYLDTSSISNNIAVGTKALRNNSSGYDNLAVGNYAAFNNVTGINNTIIGRNAAYNKTSGDHNVILGYYAASNGGTSNISDNVILGSRAGFGVEGTGNTFIGKEAGFSETGSNKLYIENSSSTSPLIYGEFDNDLVKINGKLGYANNGGYASVLSGRDSTYFSDITPGYGLSLDSNYLVVDTTLIATQYDISQIPISSLTPAISSNTIQNGDFMQEWKWDSLATGSGLKLSSNSTMASSSPSLLEVSLSGENSNSGQTTYAGVFKNYHSGESEINYALLAHSTGSSSVGLKAIGGSTGVNTIGGVYAVYAQATGTGTGVYTQSISGPAINALSVSSYGVYAKSFFYVPMAAISSDTSITGINTLITLTRETSGTAQNGIGGSIDFWVEKSGGFSGHATNRIISKWTDVSTPSSQFIITGFESTTTSELFTLSGSGALRLNKYGLGTFSGTPSKWLAVDSVGNVLELEAPAGGSDDWGTQVVETDTTLIGDGTSGNTLKVDTTIIASKHYVDSHSEGMTTYYYLTADFTTTSSSAVTITGLSFTPEENKKYAITGNLLLRTANTSVGAKVGMNWPTAGVADNGGIIRAATDTGSGSNIYFVGTTNGTTNAANTFSNTTQSHIALIQDAYLIMGSSPSGDYSATLKSNGSVTVTCKAGSYIKVVELPF